MTGKDTTEASDPIFEGPLTEAEATALEAENSNASEVVVEADTPPVNAPDGALTKRVISVILGVIVMGLIVVALIFASDSDTVTPGGIGGEVTPPTSTPLKPAKIDRGKYESKTLSFTIPSGATNVEKATNVRTEETQFVYQDKGVRVRSQDVVDEDGLKSIVDDWSSYGNSRMTKIDGRSAAIVTVSNPNTTSVMAAILKKNRLVFVQVQGPVTSKHDIEVLVRKITATARIK